jgi:heme a synthase
MSRARHLRGLLRAALDGMTRPNNAAAGSHIAGASFAARAHSAAASTGTGSSSLQGFARLTRLSYLTRFQSPSTASALVRSAFSTAAATQGAAPAFSCLVPGVSLSQRRALAWWLGGCSAWVASMVVLGGVTRLTRSGLSMTDWKFTGESPPRTTEEWMVEFARYRQSPEFRRVNASMTLEEFKFIYWMEWAHRMWGRGLGLGFALPAVYFVATGAVKAPLAKRLALLLGMGGTQGLVGWWMVRSGLEEPDSPHAVPRVSPYRLAAHLASAFVIYGTLVWTTLEVAMPRGIWTAAAASTAVSTLRRRALPVTAVIALTASSGAFVAGLDAGRAYNTFPTMNGDWIPEEYWEVPGWRNAFESTAAVQLHHRALALTTLSSVLALWATSARLPNLPKGPRMLLHALTAGVAAQVTLGVATLLNHVPVSLGAAHQAGALGLLTVALGLLYSAGTLPKGSSVGGAALALALAGIMVTTTAKGTNKYAVVGSEQEQHEEVVWVSAGGATSQ